MSATVTAKTVIVSHPNADFDAFASMLAAQLLYPGSVICLQGGANRNVREFFNLHAGQIAHTEPHLLDFAAVERMILVEETQTQRLGSLQEIAERADVELLVFDHHSGGAGKSGQNSVIGSEGSLVTTMLKLLTERRIELSTMHATAFALGIHEDTGSLIFPSTTAADVEALAFCLSAGANQELLARYLRTPLSEAQHELLAQLLSSREVIEIKGLTVVQATTTFDRYVDDVSTLVQHVGDVADWDLLVICVAMEGSTLVVARSRSTRLRADRLVETLGGGGHPQAASASIRNGDPQQLLGQLLEHVQQLASPAVTAADLMSHPLHAVDSISTVAESLVELQRLSQSGIAVREDGQLVGIALREDLDRAVRHQLGHSPVKAVMAAGVPVAGLDLPMNELRSALASGEFERLFIAGDGKPRLIDRLPIVAADGVVTRGDILRAVHELGPQRALESSAQASKKLRSRLEYIPRLSAVLPSIQAVASAYQGVYLVGGAVRDILVGETSLDLDLMVEGDAIIFASELADQLRAHVHTHEKFQTAVIKGELASGEQLSIDVATARREFYDSPGALPSVQQSTLKQDLTRRDFTINAMAASLKPDSLGAVYDFFGGYKDLEAGIIRVLHNLSFVEDPTRIFRALRYEARLGFKMDGRTESLARGCVEMQLVGELACERLRDELLEMLSLEPVGAVLSRMHEIGLDRAIDPHLSCDKETAVLIDRADVLLVDNGWGGMVQRPLLRLSLLVRKLSPERIYGWLETLKLRRDQQEIVAAAAIVPARLLPRLASTDLVDSELYGLLHGQNVETFVASAALAPDSSKVEQNIRKWLGALSKVRLEISGADLIAAGIKQSPAIGKALEQTLKLRLDGVVGGREQELAMALKLSRAEQGVDYGHE